MSCVFFVFVFVLLFLFPVIFLSLYIFLFLWSGYFVVFPHPGTLAYHFVYLDELRLFGLLFLAVCDHKICVVYRLDYRMKNKHDQT